MMKNKINFKKYLMYILVVSICLLILFLIINTYEYNTYKNNFNNKLLSILTTLKNNYPNLSESEIIEILNSNDLSSENVLEKYSIDINKESIIKENDNSSHVFIIINSIYLILTILTIIFIFLIYEKMKDKDIKEITKYIEEINNKNYTLRIDEISEDELSILKNEIYKTTIMLKENAENSNIDKVKLKKSLEDISHQIKTPLTSILVILDNLIDDPNMDNKVREEFIRDIKREIANISFFVQTILKLSKFDANTISYLKEEVLVKNIIEEAIRNVSTLCDLKNIKLEVEGKEDIVLNCDFKWQVEAITNILKNCIEHSKDYSKIIISYNKNNAYISIQIKDFGEGILKKDLPHIFERFYKGGNATKESIGIGLSLAKTIIEQNNGSISVDSDENGTRFEIRYINL